MNNANEVIGMTEADAIAKIETAGFVYRIMERDGVNFMGTCDYRTDRVNLSITEGVVTHADVG